MLEVNIVRQ